MAERDQIQIAIYPLPADTIVPIRILPHSRFRDAVFLLPAGIFGQENPAGRLAISRSAASAAYGMFNDIM